MVCFFFIIIDNFDISSDIFYNISMEFYIYFFIKVRFK